MPPQITIIEEPSAADRDAILSPLVAFNERRFPNPSFRPVAIRLSDGDRDKGGLWGKISYQWLFVELLFVPDGYRGQGIGLSLMHEAEQIARSNKCVGIWLDTFQFQARGFYERLGFKVFGELKDNPPGESHFFMCKRFE